MSGAHPIEMFNGGAITLPESWTAKIGFHDHTVCLSSPPGAGGFTGSVTVDFELRQFALGEVDVGRNPDSDSCLKDKSHYVGRGWRQQLVDDAVEALREAMTQGGDAMTGAQAPNKLQALVRAAIAERQLSTEVLAQRLHLLPVGVEVLFARKDWSFEQSCMIAEALDLKIDIEIKVSWA